MRSGEYGEWLELDDIKVDDSKLAQDVVRELFERLLQGGSLHLALARYTLRRAGALRCRNILQALLDNLDRFVPVLRDVIHYLLRVKSESTCGMIGASLNKMLDTSPYRALPFVQYWLLHAIQSFPAFSNADAAMRHSERASPLIRDRMLALSAKAYGLSEWVRSRKEAWNSGSAHAQRAIVWASAVLPVDERAHWLQPIRNSEDHELRFVADAAFQQGR